MSETNSNGSSARRRAAGQLPYKAHPLYQTRKALIIVACVGIFLAFTTLGIPYSGGSAVFTIICLVLSGFFSLCDLQNFAMKKVQDPDHDPEWPTRFWMVGDFLLALFLFFQFFFAAGNAEYGYYGSHVISAYAALANLAASVLHVYSFWKELMARYKNKWWKELSQAPCPRCGYLDNGTPSDNGNAPARTNPPNLSAYVGPTASSQSATAFTPHGTESSMEEGLLIGSCCNSGYGSISPDEPEPVVDQPNEVTVGPSRKKRTVGNGVSRFMEAS